ncbi:MAG: RagB/SusD family nutrient uptake outer membrane protein [Prevotellaceae bacterium]|nr:RagB/SusD family nutrient uptake outer membrane protein [Prevotellaceae bacterium]
MKNILRNIAIASVVATGLAVTSCEDMMTVDTGDKVYQNAQDTLYSYLGIMRAMQDVAERQVILGEIRGDLVSSSNYTTDTLFAISNFDNPQDQSCSMLNVSDYYNVINNCNFYIQYADTSAVRANNPDPYMMNEYAQVKAIRAWAYLQLVKNYRAVPFITEPISDPAATKNFDYSANLVTKDNLVDRLVEDGLAKYVDQPYPQYGNPSNPTSQRWGIWETGDVRVSSRLCFIPIRVVLGDLYLLRGGAGDYERAARYYYDFFRTDDAPPMADQYVTDTIRAGKVVPESNIGGWGNWAASYEYNVTTNEVISLIPSASNAAFGKILTRVADIYGYTPSPQQFNLTNNDNDAVDVRGSISVTPTYKRQYGPSNAYMDIVNQQTYIDYKKNNNGTYSPLFRANEDARYYFSIGETSDDEGEAYPLCSKAAKGYSFYYTIPTYRRSLIWLRLAEAINRAGHPEFAFAILKDGLNGFTIPTIRDDNKKYKITTITGTDQDGDYYTKLNTRDSILVYVAVEGDTPNDASPRYLYEEGVFVPYPGYINSDIWQWEMVDYRGIRYYDSNQPLYYVTDTLKLQNFNSFLDFSEAVWNGTYGIHAKGSGGIMLITNGIDTYSKTTISGHFDNGYYDYGTLLEKYGVDPSNATKNDTINAVENIIVDELALETAFEGNRFTDLVRIAEHKNASGYDGTEWLARKIANRGTKAAVDNTPAIEGFNDEIYSKLKNTNNWYFELPKVNAK